MLLSDAVDNRRAVSSFIYFDATASATPSVLDASAEACGTFDGSIVLRRLATVHFATSSSCSDLFLSIRSCWFPAQRSRGWPSIGTTDLFERMKRGLHTRCRFVRLRCGAEASVNASCAADVVPPSFLSLISSMLSLVCVEVPIQMIGLWQI